MNWLLFFLFASIQRCFCSKQIAKLEFSPEIIEEFKKLEVAFSTKKIASLREASNTFHEGSQNLEFDDLCKCALEYALDNDNWPFAKNLFNEFRRNDVVPLTGKYCLLALSKNDMNQAKISFGLIQDAAEKTMVLLQALRERKFVLVGFDSGVNWDLLSQTDLIRVFRSAIKYKQFSQVYQCLGEKVANFALRNNSLLIFAVQEDLRVAIETLLAHFEVFASLPDDLDISAHVPGFHPETSYSQYLCYYYYRVHTKEHLLHPFWKNFFRLNRIDDELAVRLLSALEQAPRQHGPSTYSCLSRIVRIISVSDLPISSLKKFSSFFDSFGTLNVAINSGNIRFLNYVLKNFKMVSFRLKAVGFAESSLTRGICYILSNKSFIKFLKDSYENGQVEFIVSMLRLVDSDSSLSKIQVTEIWKALFMNLPEIVWIFSKSINPVFFNPREDCWLMKAIHWIDHTEALPNEITENWRDLMILEAYSSQMMRLILATYGIYDESDSKMLISVCLHLNDFDSALMALKSANGQFQLESPRPFLPGILNNDLPFAEKLFSPTSFCPVIKLYETSLSCRFSQDRQFYGTLLSSIIEIIEADHKPLLRYILTEFDILPHDILSIQQFALHHKIIGACYGIPDWTKLCFKSFGPVLVFLASCPLSKVNVVLPYLGMMNTLQLIKTCLFLESDSHL